MANQTPFWFRAGDANLSFQRVCLLNQQYRLFESTVLLKGAICLMDVTALEENEKITMKVIIERPNKGNIIKCYTRDETGYTAKEIIIVTDDIKNVIIKFTDVNGDPCPNRGVLKYMLQLQQE